MFLSEQKLKTLFPETSLPVHIQGLEALLSEKMKFPVALSILMTKEVYTYDAFGNEQYETFLEILLTERDMHLLVTSEEDILNNPVNVALEMLTHLFKN